MIHHPGLAALVRSQRQQSTYARVDLDRRPERLALGPDEASFLPDWVGADRGELLADEALVELFTTTTMPGDVVADPYAALLAEHPLGHLVGMLARACESGVDAVADAPPELARFIAAMEVVPGWLDMELVERGAREARLQAALLAPFITRGAFVATFMNTYAALPMALTGALTGARAAHRVNETTSFFAVTTQPGALDRHGRGFQAAAMVRLMHAMVRVHALTRSERWDPAVYGVPVPQCDQLPANYITTYLLARKVLRSGRTAFTDAERALVEFARYRGFLLGMPEELLPTGPEEIVRVLHTWGAVLRDGFDDATCGELVRSTMAAYLRSGDTWFDRIADEVEKSWSKTFFLRGFAGNDRDRARAMGVDYGLGDTVRVAATAPFVVGRYVGVGALRRVPLLAEPVDRYLVAMVERRLREYGKPEFTSDHTSYADARRATAPG